MERSLIDSSPRQLAGTFFASSVAVFSRKSISILDHPPYSPELTPADFWLFPNLKRVLKEKRFSDVEDIKSSAKEKKRHIPIQVFENCFQQWPKHWVHCKELEGDQFEKFNVGNICSS